MSEAEIVAVIRGGACSAEDIGERCRAGTGCGHCVEDLHELIEDFGPGAGGAAGGDSTAQEQGSRDS
ncbi:(2Fe-2S)-binding protein [Streptomyces similanensis]|uniref:BFD-like [2Fe-2S]-binding domain-containing protein n=1 Tax=Streptomyces similanensis TaxID=1274988 RepID=A0ABP9LLG3_9ACTN